MVTDTRVNSVGRKPERSTMPVASTMTTATSMNSNPRLIFESMLGAIST